MDLVEARQLARRLMKQHALDGWRFMFDHAKRRFGSCRYRQKLITLSKPLTLLNPQSHVADTLLHEIAHALTPGGGHGPLWRACCRQIGATPASRYSEEVVAAPPRAEAKYLLGCPSCGWWVNRHRLHTRKLLCAKCRTRIHYRDKATGQLFIPATGPDGTMIKRPA